MYLKPIVIFDHWVCAQSRVCLFESKAPSLSCIESFLTIQDLHTHFPAVISPNQFMSAYHHLVLLPRSNQDHGITTKIMVLLPRSWARTMSAYYQDLWTDKETDGYKAAASCRHDWDPDAWNAWFSKGADRCWSKNSWFIILNILINLDDWIRN